MPIGGKLLLKGGKSLKPKRRKKAKKQIPEELLTETLGVDAQTDGGRDKDVPDTGAPEASVNPASVSVQSGKAYEQEFSLEMKKAAEGKTRNTPWGSSFRAPPEVLHGYDRKVKGDNAEERLDLRCAMKGDKFCK